MSTPTRRGRRTRRQGNCIEGASRSNAGQYRLRRKTADRPAKLIRTPARAADAAPGAVDLSRSPPATDAPAGLPARRGSWPFPYRIDKHAVVDAPRRVTLACGSRKDAAPACIGDFEVTPREGGHAHDLPFPPVPIDPKRAGAEPPVRDLNFDLKRLQKAHDDGSHGTRTARSYALAQAADTLHELGFKGLRATGLRRKHVVALVREWKRQGRSIGTMKNRTAHIRWWAKWVGRPGVVPANGELGIANCEYVGRTRTGAPSSRRRSWRGVKDPHVAMALRLVGPRCSRAREEVAGVDGGGGELAGLADVRAAPWTPGRARLGAVGVRRRGRASSRTRRGGLRGPVRDSTVRSSSWGVDLGAVLGAFEVAELRFQCIGGAVEAVHLGVEEVDEAPQERFAFVGELGAVAGDVVVANAWTAESTACMASSSSHRSRLSGSSGPGVAPNRSALLADDGGGGAVLCVVVVLCVVHGRSPR